MKSIDQQIREAVKALKEANPSDEYSFSIVATFHYCHHLKKEGFDHFHAIATGAEPLPQLSCTGSDLSEVVSELLRKVGFPKEHKARELREKAAELLRQAEQFEAAD